MEQAVQEMTDEQRRDTLLRQSLVQASIKHRDAATEEDRAYYMGQVREVLSLIESTR